MKIRKNDFLLSLIIFTVLVLIVVFSLTNIYEIKTNSKGVVHSYEVKMDLANNFSLLKDVETSARGFALTGNKDFKEPADLAMPAIQKNISHLRTLLQDDPIQLVKLDSLKELIDLKTASVIEIINAREKLGLNAASEIVSTQRGKIAMDNIRKLSDRMAEIQGKLLIERKRIAADSYFIAQLFAVVGGILAILIAILLLIINNRSLKLKTTLLSSEAKYKQASLYSRSLIEASLDPLVTISPLGKITDVNDASAKVTGETREKLIGTDFSDYFTEPEKAREGYKQVFEKGFVSDYPLTIHNRNGKLTDVLYNASVYKDDKGKVLGVFAAARDVSEQKRTTEKLKEARVAADLATVTAEDAKLVAENALHSKQLFLANMSHEIRTPMNAILGFTKILLKQDVEPKQKEYLDAIKTSSDGLLVLINDILDLAKVNSGKMTFEETPFKMESSVTTMLQVFEFKIQEKNLEIVKEYDNRIPKVLLGDAGRLHQILLNLLSNAIKFTEIGKITIAVGLLKEDEEKVIIEFAITDTGTGIPEDKLVSIFENFHQATSSTSRLFGGTGLGLAICKQLIEKQGGTILVKSKVNEGSTFSFTLGFQKTSTEIKVESTGVELDNDIKVIKVLLVEDIKLNQLLMKIVLDDFKFKYDIVDNGEIAIEKMQKEAYDIILMDLQMPVMNGFEATEYIRKVLKSKIPIIALTADVTTVDLEKCKAAGMNDYVSKPLDERILYSKMIQLLKR